MPRAMGHSESAAVVMQLHFGLQAAKWGTGSYPRFGEGGTTASDGSVDQGAPPYPTPKPLERRRGKYVTFDIRPCSWGAFEVSQASI